MIGFCLCVGAPSLTAFPIFVPKLREANSELRSSIPLFFRNFLGITLIQNKELKSTYFQQMHKIPGGVALL
jgi:hypothetical protein